MTDLRAGYADVRATQSLARLARQHALEHGSPAVQAALADLAAELQLRVPGADGPIISATLAEAADECGRRYSEVGGPTSAMPSARIFGDWTAGLPLEYDDVLAVTDDVSETVLAGKNGHSTKAMLRCASLGCIVIGAENSRWHA